MWGWEPREFTERHYDAAGRFVGSTTTREPEFNTEQVALLLAHMRAKRDLGPHGQPMSEATDPQANPSFDGGWRYESNATPRIDYAELALQTQMDAFYKKYEGRFTEAQKRAHQWYVHRVDA